MPDTAPLDDATTQQTSLLRTIDSGPFSPGDPRSNIKHVHLLMRDFKQDSMALCYSLLA